MVRYLCTLAGVSRSGYYAWLMVLEKTKGICINRKRIYRIMRKYNLVTKIRRENPYKHIAKAT
ncbi:IS3 family transposase (plasmid) [Bacillus cereus]|nr:IS3 family transposase [Bacillus cereus]